MRYAIGLDIGITSVGHAVVELDSNDEPCRIIRLGSRIFDKAENPKNGASLALPRREARGMRRRLRRLRHRKERIRGMLIAEGVVTSEQLEHLYDDKQLSDVYMLRVKALDEPLTAEEFARVLIHLSQRRGFLSNRKTAKGKKDDGKLLEATSANRLLMQEKGYRTVGEMFYRDEKFDAEKRNKSGNYQNTVDRALIEAEAKLVFGSQRKFGKHFADSKIEERYLSILLAQRSFADGPACGPYSGNQIEKMIGNCTFEEGKLRASKATYSFQLFNLWQHINHIRIVSEDGLSRVLSDDERNAIVSEAHKKPEVTFKQIRALLPNMKETDTFNVVRYLETVEDSEKKKKLDDLKVYHDIRKAFGKTGKTVFETLSHEQLDVIGESISKNYSDEQIAGAIIVAGIAPDAVEFVQKLPNYSKYGHLSVEACRKLLPHLKNGSTYDKACEMAGYQFQGNISEKQMYLRPLSEEDGKEITSPVVKRAVSQSIKVINAIIREMKESPVYVNIELARELSKSYDDRSKIEKQQKENAAQNERIMQQIKEYKDAPTGFDLVKFKLWNEQGEICPYTQKKISISRLFDTGYVDVDHIVPYSRSFDDRAVNKVLVFSEENRQKGNRLPLEYLKGERRDKFIVWVKSHPKFSPAKRKLLLKENVGDEEGLKARNLQDTQFISSFMYRYIADTLLFAPSMSGKKRRVYTVNGAITAQVRKRWGINKIREDGDLHHAMDAAVIACVTPGMVARITRYAKYREGRFSEDFVVDRETGEVIEHFPEPWESFRDELTIRLCENEQDLRKQLQDVNFPQYLGVDLDGIKAPFVSRMCNHKVTGPAHKETVRSGKLLDKGVVVSKVELSKLKLNKEGEIEGYYNPESDRLLYEALRERLKAFGGDAKKAFENEFHKPRANGLEGPLVKKVKIVERASLAVGVLENTGVADNDTMIRCDVFYCENDGYYFVPIYVADTVKDCLPSKACVSGGKPWKAMDEKDFLFSLYPNDLIRIYDKKELVLARVLDGGTLPEKRSFDGSKGVLLYYKGLDISTAFLSGVTHDNTYKRRTIGKTTLRIEKYEVDVLGNYSKIEKETRQTFQNMKK